MVVEGRERDLKEGGEKGKGKRERERERYIYIFLLTRFSTKMPALMKHPTRARLFGSDE